MTLALYVLTKQSEYLVTGDGLENLFEQLKKDFTEFEEDFIHVERLFAIKDNEHSDVVEDYIRDRIAQEVGI